jgi:hypothetical protein
MRPLAACSSVTETVAIGITSAGAALAFEDLATAPSYDPRGRAAAATQQT